MDPIPSGEVASAFGSALGQAVVIILGALLILSGLLSALFAKAWALARKNGNGSAPISVKKTDWSEAESLLFGDVINRLGRIEVELGKTREEIRELRDDVQEIRRANSGSDPRK